MGFKPNKEEQAKPKLSDIVRKARLGLKGPHGAFGGSKCAHPPVDAGAEQQWSLASQAFTSGLPCLWRRQKSFDGFR